MTNPKSVSIDSPASGRHEREGHVSRRTGLLFIVGSIAALVVVLLLVRLVFAPMRGVALVRAVKQQVGVAIVDSGGTADGDPSYATMSADEIAEHSVAWYWWQDSTVSRSFSVNGWNYHLEGSEYGIDVSQDMIVGLGSSTFGDNTGLKRHVIQIVATANSPQAKVYVGLRRLFE